MDEFIKYASSVKREIYHNNFIAVMNSHPLTNEHSANIEHNQHEILNNIHKRAYDLMLLESDNLLNIWNKLKQDWGN